MASIDSVSSADLIETIEAMEVVAAREEEPTIVAHLVGDSTIDNWGWVAEDPTDRNSLEAAWNKTVEGKLTGRLGTFAKVYNWAQDGFTTKSVLNGDVVGRIFADEFPERFGDGSTFADVRVGKGSKEVKPLEQIREKIEQLPNAVHKVVISVMGNDFRELLGANPISLLSEIPAAQQRYLEIARHVKEMGAEPVFMYQYRTERHPAPEEKHYDIYREFSLIGRVASGLFFASVVGMGFGIASFAMAATAAKAVAGLVGAGAIFGIHQLVPIWIVGDLFKGRDLGIALYGRLMEKLYAPINKWALENSVAILDLPNTINPYHRLFVMEIEPNEEGADLIAEGIEKVIRTHTPDMGSHRYFKPWDGERYVHKEMREEWHVEMPPKSNRSAVFAT